MDLNKKHHTEPNYSVGTKKFKNTPIFGPVACKYCSKIWFSYPGNFLFQKQPTDGPMVRFVKIFFLDRNPERRKLLFKFSSTAVDGLSYIMLLLVSMDYVSFRSYLLDVTDPPTDKCETNFHLYGLS